DGFEWVEIRTNGDKVRGWVTSDAWKAYHPNRIANADLSNSLNLVSANTPSTTLARVQHVGADAADWYAEAVCAGTAPDEGLRFASHDNLGLNHKRKCNASFFAKADRAVRWDAVTVRVMYADGTETDRTASVRLTTTEKFVVLPTFDLAPDMTIAK